MANTNGKVPGTYVSPQELKDLSELLASFRDYILSHEARIELIEGWIGEFMQAQDPLPEVETDGTSEAEASEAAAENEGLAFESPNDPA